MSWRLARSLVVLRDEINERFPDRNKASDGTIGDVRHQNEGSGSDHNPWIKDNRGIGVVRAFDITAASIPAAELAEFLRALGKGGDPRLADHGYVIYNRQIASGTHVDWAWRAFTGADPHTSHIHVSVSRLQSGYDITKAWGIAAEPAPSPSDPDKPGWVPGSRTIHVGSTSDDVRYLARRFFGAAQNDVFGAALEAAVKKFQKRNHLPPTGIVDRNTWKALGVTTTY